MFWESEMLPVNWSKLLVTFSAEVPLIPMETKRWAPVMGLILLYPVDRPICG